MTTLVPGPAAGRAPTGHHADRLAWVPPVWLTPVRGRSMEPTLHPGQLVPTRRIRATDPVRRGDVVVADSTELGRRIIKRVIGLPGEHVLILDGQVIVEGRPLDEPYARPSIFNGRFLVPDDSVLLLGDNRDASRDSRTWSQPYIPRSQLRGRLHPTGRAPPSQGAPVSLVAGDMKQSASRRRPC